IAAFCVATVAFATTALAQTERVSIDSAGGEGNGLSLGAALSRDGRFVAFMSTASNLVTDDTNQSNDIFVRDRRTGVTERVSVTSNGQEANAESGFPTLSADGRFVAFASAADNLTPGDTNGQYDGFVHDRRTGSTTCVSVDQSGQPANSRSGPSVLSADGRVV